MQIKFNNIIVAGEWTEQTSDLSREAGIQTQRVEFLNGSEPSWINRDNYSSRISWKRQIQFASIVACEVFFLEHGDNEGTKDKTDLTGIVEFTMKDETQTQIRYARGALNIRFGTPVGVHLDVFYSLEHGRITKTKITDA